MVEAALDGAGITQVLEHMVEHHLREGRLVELLPACRPAPLPVSVLVPVTRMMPSRVRSLIDELAGRDKRVRAARQRERSSAKD